MPIAKHPKFEVSLASDPSQLRDAQALRYEVFVEELGGDGPLVDHAARLERDEFDPHYDHMLLYDRAKDGNQVVGVYRLLPPQGFARAGRYYTESEYELAPLLRSKRRLLELGRSCLHADYRGGSAMLVLWQALASYVLERKIQVLFGVASFHGTDLRALAAPLSLLHEKYLAPEDIRVRAQPNHYQSMDLCPPDQIDRVAAMKAVPQLIKAYLRMGGFVGEGAFVDHAFNTTDVCLVVDMARLNPRTAKVYAQDIAL